MDPQDQPPSQEPAFRVSRAIGGVDIALGVLALIYGIGVLGGGMVVGAPWWFALVGVAGMGAAGLLIHAGALLRPETVGDLRDAHRGLWFGVIAGLPLALGAAFELIEGMALDASGRRLWVGFATNLIAPALTMATNGIPLLVYGGRYRNPPDISTTFE